MSHSQFFPGPGYRLNEAPEGQPGLNAAPGAPQQEFEHKANEHKEALERKAREKKESQLRLRQAIKLLLEAYRILEKRLEMMESILDENHLYYAERIFDCCQEITSLYAEDIFDYGEGIDNLFDHMMENNSYPTVGHKVEETLFYHDVLRTVNDLLQNPLNTETHTRLLNLSQGLKLDGEVRNISMGVEGGSSALSKCCRLLAALAITALYVTACVFLPPLGAGAIVGLVFLGVLVQLPTTMMAFTIPCDKPYNRFSTDNYSLFSKLKQLHHNISENPKAAGELDMLAGRFQEAKAANPQAPLRGHRNPPSGVVDIAHAQEEGQPNTSVSRATQRR